MKAPHLHAALGAMACLALACGDDDGSAPNPMDAASPVVDGSVADGSLLPSLDATSGSAPDAAVPAPKTPLVIVSERETPDNAIQYLHVLPDFPANRKLDASNAVELGSYVAVHSGNGAVWVYQPEDSTVQKYTVDAQLTVKPDVKISFAAYGVSGYDPDIVWVSADRAFLVDEKTGQIILWNPATMSIVRSSPIDAALLKRNGLPLQLQANGVVAGGRAWMSANWRDWDTYDHVPGAALAWFDVAAETPVLNIIHEDRCAASVDAPFVDEAGNVYVIGDGALGFDLIASPKKSTLPQCMRRVLAGQTQFDTNFFVDLQAASGSPGFRDSHPMGNGKVLLNLWAPSLKVSDYAKPSPDWYFDPLPVFEYVIIDTASKSATPVAALPRADAQFSTTLRVDGANYVQSYRADNGVVVSRVGIDGSVTEVLDLGMGTDVQYFGRL